MRDKVDKKNLNYYQQVIVMMDHQVRVILRVIAVVKVYHHQTIKVSSVQVVTKKYQKRKRSNRWKET